MSNRIQEMKLKHTRELRESIGKYQILHPRQKKELSYEFCPNTVNLIVFGPTGSGKSSLIKTFYNALYNTQKLSDKYEKDLVIQQLSHNEGTKKFTNLTLKPSSRSVVKTETKELVTETSGVSVMDTRGQVLMDDKEIGQIDVLIDGRVKDMTQVEQRNWRYAYLLWEFWKRDSELFPSDMLVNKSLDNQPHSLIFVFDGSLDEIPNGEEETKFYKGIIQLARKKKYFNPQIVLTRVDKVEEKIKKQFQKQGKKDETELESTLRELIDTKIEDVVWKIGIPRENVHFIENYHGQCTDNNVDVDYYALKLLSATLKESDVFIENNLPPKSSCNVF